MLSFGFEQPRVRSSSIRDKIYKKRISYQLNDIDWMSCDTSAADSLI